MTNNKNVKVTNMTSPRSGKAVANQYIVTTENGRYFQSYDSMIAYIPNSGQKIQLDQRYWDYSATTGKYRNEFLNEGIAVTRKKIKAGEYELVDLNQ